MSFALAVAAVPAAAQQRGDGADDATQTLDQVNVTGTHLRRVDAETASPVVVIDRQRIEDSGQNTLGQLLQRLPMMAGFQAGPALNSGFSHGRALVSLRNLGPERTLVLVNGHRMAGPASSVASAPGVDVNAIPAAMVERVEVLTDGASSVYGYPVSAQGFRCRPAALLLFPNEVSCRPPGSSLLCRLHWRSPPCRPPRNSVAMAQTMPPRPWIRSTSPAPICAVSTPKPPARSW
ncbi:TonB-dependent receptor [Xanthomonas axonopodis Xac29-1]|nr:TonB-dependent receptor [Xanthomonas axonopodis Xac29-1]